MNSQFSTSNLQTVRFPLRSGFLRGLRNLFSFLAALIHLRHHRRLRFSWLTRTVAMVQIVLMAVPVSSWSYILNGSCNDGPCACGEAENGGDASDGNGDGSESEACDPCDDDSEDDNQIDEEQDPVLLGRQAIFLKSRELRPLGVPGQLRTATLAFGRYHNSKMGYNGPLGGNWTHNYDVTVADLGSSVILRSWNGTTKTFSSNGDGTYNGDGSTKLFRNGSGDLVWQLRHGTQYRFDANAGDRLTNITNRNGYAVTLTYDENNYLTNVADFVGRNLVIRNDGNGLIQEVVDPLGRTNAYKYDELGRLTNVVDALGSKASYAYDADSSRVKAITNPRGKTHTYTYDEAYRIIGETNAAGRWEAYTRDDILRTCEVRNWNGGTFTIHNDPNGRFTNWVTPEGTSSKKVRDEFGRTTSRISKGGHATAITYAPGGCACGINGGKITQTDPLNRTKSWGYNNNFNFRTAFTNAAGDYRLWACDTRGNRTNYVDALRQPTVYQYDALGSRTHIIDPYLHTNRFFYDQFGNRTNHTDPLGRVTRYGYDILGRMTNRVDALNRTNRYFYDARDRLSRRINALGYTNAWAYDGTGNVTAHTNELGRVWQYTYDDVGLRTSVTLPGGSSPFETYNYDGNRNRIAVTNALGQATRYGYDGLNRLTKITNALNKVWSFAYDADGHRTNSIDPVGRTNKFGYDAAGQLTSVTLPSSASPFLQYGYNLVGNRVAATNALGQITRFAYDAESRLTGITNALNKAWLFAYDANGMRTNSSDPNLHTNRYTYDAAGQLTAVTNALNQGVQFQYDGVGNRTNLIDAKGNAVGFGYDPLNRLTNIAYGATDKERFQYDPAGNLTNYVARDGNEIQFKYDGENRLTNKFLTYGFFVDTFRYGYDAAGRLTNAVTLSGGEIEEQSNHFSYDAAGRLTNETSTLWGENSFTVGYEYEASGRRSKLTYPDNTFVTYEYNTNGWLTAIKDGGTNAIVTYEYDSAGRRTKRTLENSTFTVLDYDDAGQVTNLWHKKSAGGATISRYQFGYDDAGQRTWIKRADGYGDVFKYDPTDQLTNVQYGVLNPDTAPSGWDDDVSYSFDAAGNRTSVNSFANATITTYTVNTLNQYTAVDATSLTYDANGNLTFDGIRDHEYDCENRLSFSFDGVNTDVWLHYDGLGRMIMREAGWITRFIYDSEWRVIAEYSDSNGYSSPTAKYVYGPGIDEPVRMTRSGTNYYYHAAALGTVTEITSATGTLLEQYSYDVYGTPTFKNGSGGTISGSAIGNRLLFQGRDRDPDTGLYNFRHRYYSPALGRFVQVDPIRFLGGLNLYSFVRNCPLNHRDPKGLVAFEDDWYSPAMPTGTAMDTYLPLPPSSQNNADNTPSEFAGGCDIHLSWVNPFTSDGGGVLGDNEMTFFGKDNKTRQFVYDGGGLGLDVGISAQSVWAWGSGEWTGTFRSVNLGLGPLTGSVFWSPGSGGWVGLSFGVTIGLPTLSLEETEYYETAD